MYQDTTELTKNMNSYQQLKNISKNIGDVNSNSVDTFSLPIQKLSQSGTDDILQTCNSNMMRKGMDSKGGGGGGGGGTAAGAAGGGGEYEDDLGLPLCRTFGVIS